MFKDSWTLFFISALVLGVWYFLGFIVPIYTFKDLGVSGQFGDSFGSVTSLFTGFTLIGLIWTIRLQLNVVTEQKRQDKLKMYFDLANDIKNDLFNFESLGKKGVGVTINLCEMMETLRSPNPYTIPDEVYKFYTNILFQFEHLIYVLENENIIEKDEKQLLKAKLSNIYLAYFLELHNAVARVRTNSVGNEFPIFKTTINNAAIRAEKYLNIIRG